MTETTLKIDGMACSMCESHINDAIRAKFDVKKVHSSHRSGETVIVSESSLPEEKIREVIKSTGYTLLSMTEKPYEKKGLFGRKK